METFLHVPQDSDEGWIDFPNGMIMQFGTSYGGGGLHNFPKPFPHRCISVTLQAESAYLSDDYKRTHAQPTTNNFIHRDPEHVKYSTSMCTYYNQTCFDYWSDNYGQVPVAYVAFGY